MDIADKYFKSRKLLEKIYLSDDSILQSRFSSYLENKLDRQEKALVISGFSVCRMVLFLFWCIPDEIIEAANSCGITSE